MTRRDLFKRGLALAGLAVMSKLPAPEAHPLTPGSVPQTYTLVSGDSVSWTIIPDGKTILVNGVVQSAGATLARMGVSP